MKKSTKNLLWLLLLIVLTVCTVLIITSCSKGFSFKGFMHLISNASPVWILFAALCAFGFVFFEGMGLKCTCDFLGEPITTGKAILYSATDIYFSALTPSAAGGQPAALLMMMNHGVSAAVSAIALLLNLVMYTVSIMLISTVCFIVYPEMLFKLDTGALIFIIIGAVVQVLFIVLFVMCIFNEKLVLAVCRFCLKLLCRMKIFHNYDEHHEKLLSMIKQYKECGILLRHKTMLLLKVFFHNLMQRLSVIMVAVCVFVGVGGAPSRAFEAFAAQTFAVLGSNAAPVPGAVGIVDYIFLNGFEHLVADPVSVELLSRGLSFYCNLIFCGILMFVNFIRMKPKTGLERND